MRKDKKGFTLIELLVVISIIALLVSILMPALNKAKQQAYTTTCLANQKALIMAWTMYNDDNSDTMVCHYVISDTMKGGSRPHSWVEPPQNPETGAFLGGWGNLESFQNSGGNIQKAREAGIENGALWKYIKDVEVYHCTGDKRFQDAITDAQVYRTYGIPAGLGSAGDFRSEGGHNSSTYIKKASSIKYPTEKYVFGEASYDCFFGKRDNSGTNYLDQYILDLGTYYHCLKDGPELSLWIPNSIWHNNSSTYGFADGHADSHKWLTKDIIEHFKDRITNMKQTLEVPYTNEDAIWLFRHYPNSQNF